jgi:hypothetical protein
MARHPTLNLSKNLLQDLTNVINDKVSTAIKRVDGH